MLSESSDRAVAVGQGRAPKRALESTSVEFETLAMVVHDLKSPLNGIQMLARLILKRLDDRTPVYAAEIIHATERMDHLILDLLEAAKLGTLDLPLAMAPAAPGLLLEEARRALLSHASAASIYLEIEVERWLPPVLVDRDRIHQVLANLIGNAIKFAPQGSRVVLSARGAFGCVCFSVSDDGPGIAPVDLPHVFERFWQSQPDDHQGSGLGLWIARRIVEGHRGRIWAESTPACGAAFSFTLPLVDVRDDENGSRAPSVS